MNKRNLTAAVLAGLAGVAGIAGTAQAVNMNPDGLGQVLIYPYYTANMGNSTMLSVVNTTDHAKAVKVRFLEGYNSREVLDFNLYLSEWDVWVASIEAGEAGPKLVIPDTSCTVPYLYDADLGFGEQPFLDLAFTGAFADGGPTGITRAAEGHFEIIEMGTLTGAAADAVRHGVNDMPANCELLTTWWTDFAGTSNAGVWYEEADAKDNCTPYSTDETEIEFAGCQADSYTTRNSGGLFGAASIVNVEDGTMFSYDAQALQGFDTTEDGIHFIPGTIFPSLNSGNVSDSWIFFGVPRNEPVFLDYANTVDAVSSVFMHEAVMNEYYSEAAYGAGTEWIVTFPTKNFYADEWRMEEVGLIEQECTGTGEDEVCVNVPRAPFTEFFGAADCEVVSLKTWDREENTFEPTNPDNPVRPPVVSPSLPSCDPAVDPRCAPGETPFQLCNEVNVLRFGEKSVFNSPTISEGGTDFSLVVEVEDEFTAGWGRLTFGARHDELGLSGLPVTGFAAQSVVNEYLSGGVKANYGGLFRHKGDVRQVSVPVVSPQ